VEPRSNIAYLSEVPKPSRAQQPRIEPFMPTIAGHIEGAPAPIEFIVDGLIPKRDIMVLSGPEGIGKTSFCMQAMISVAMGIPLLGRATRKCKSLAMFFEDPHPQLHALRNRICSAYDIDPVATEDWIAWCDRSRNSQVIYETNRWKLPGNPTHFWEAQLKQYIADNGIELLFLDSSGCVFFGESAGEVRCFLKWLIRESDNMDIGTVLLHHPAKARDNWYSGVKEWATVPRFGGSFDIPQKPKEKNEERMWWDKDEDTGERVLTIRKGSYLRHDDPLKRFGLPMKWENGIFVEQPLPASAWPLRPDEQAALDCKVLTVIGKLVDARERVYRAASSSRSFSRIVSAWDKWSSYDPYILDTAVERLLSKDQLVEVFDGKTVLVRTAGQPYHWEKV